MTDHHTLAPRDQHQCGVEIDQPSEILAPVPRRPGDINLRVVSSSILTEELRLQPHQLIEIGVHRNIDLGLIDHQDTAGIRNRRLRSTGSISTIPAAVITRAEAPFPTKHSPHKLATPNSSRQYSSPAVNASVMYPCPR